MYYLLSSSCSFPGFLIFAFHKVCCVYSCIRAMLCVCAWFSILANLSTRMCKQSLDTKNNARVNICSHLNTVLYRWISFISTASLLDSCHFSFSNSCIHCNSWEWWFDDLMLLMMMIKSVLKLLMITFWFLCFCVTH